MNYTINITDKQINCNIISRLFNETTGATVSFLGTIKKTNNNKNVKNILYIIFNDLFISIFKKKCIYLLNEKKESKIYIMQASGLLTVGSINSLIAVTAKTRLDAFYICRDLVETLKYNTPIWKKEFYTDGSFIWINA